MKHSMLRFAFGIIFLSSLTFSTESRTQEADAAKLRSRYFNRDYEGGAVLGQEWVAQFPQHDELRAWFILNMARNDLAAQAVAAADKMIATEELSPWSWFALAGALNWSRERREEALPASKKALSLLPDHPDVIWMRAETLMRQGKEEQAIDFVDKNSAKLRNPAELDATRGNAIYSLWGMEEDKFEQALHTFAKARQLDLSNVSAHVIPAVYLSRKGRNEEALPLLKKALALAPNSTGIHERYWQAILGIKSMATEAKRKEIESDIEPFLQNRGDYPGALQAVSAIYRDLKLTDKLTATEDKILTRFPESRQAEWVLVKRCRNFRREFGADGFKDREKELEYHDMLQEFIRRSHHHNESLLGETYLNLFFSVKNDSTVPTEDLLKAVNGMVQYEKINPHVTYAQGATALAERKAYFREAEHIARAGMTEAKKRIEKRRRMYETEAEYENALNRVTALMHDALGWIFYHENRYTEAEKELLQAYNLNPKNLDNLYRLGRLYEAQDSFNKAEKFYIKGMSVQRPGENPSGKALESLYKKRHGSLEGLDDFMAKIADRDRERRKNEILNARIEQPEPAEPFVLKALDGQEVTMENLKGRVVVINYWGIWCGWCVVEMPEFKKLHEKYREDPNVVILTINNDRNPDDVAPWMQKNGYDFTVLIDDGYVSSQAKIRAFPTTWFLDLQGRKAFIKEGWSEKLVEEFSWRIEALREKNN